MSAEDFFDGLSNDLAQKAQAEQAIIGAYETTDRRQIKAAALLEYRCRRGCLLLRAWQSPVGLLFYQPGYKLSPTLNDQSSSAAGRAKNTRDGERRWKAKAGRLDDMRGWGKQAGLPLQCDHTNLTQSSVKLFDDADAATPGRPTRRTF